MKMFVSLFFMVNFFSGYSFISQSLDASPKVLEVFSQTFKNPKDVTWFFSGDESTVAFFDNEIRTIITYDKNANFLFSRRSYGESNLPFNILIKVKEKYKAKKIGIVAEVIEEGAVTYSVNLEDEQNVYVIESDGNANMKIRSKFKKQKV